MFDNLKLFTHLSVELERYTAANSNFDRTRPYVSMSHVTLSEEEIMALFLNGFEDSLAIRLRCYKGYQMERDLKERISKVFPDQVKFGIEIEAFQGMVLGHPDFFFAGYPADCKSVPLDEHLPGGKLPRRVYWQMQAYMKYSLKSQALVIYESRETGRIMHYWIRENLAIQAEINHKLQRVVEAIGNIKINRAS